MIIAPRAPDGAAWDEASLHALGALSISDHRDEAGALIGYRLEPAIDLGAYAASVAASRKARLLAYAAERRFARETAGVLIAKVPVATDRDSQAMINGACAYLQASPAGTTIRFKSPAGFVEFDLEQITAVGLAVGAHVQDAFAREADAIAGIEGGLLESREAVDACFA